MRKIRWDTVNGTRTGKAHFSSEYIEGVTLNVLLKYILQEHYFHCCRTEFSVTYPMFLMCSEDYIILEVLPVSTQGEKWLLLTNLLKTVL